MHSFEFRWVRTFYFILSYPYCRESIGLRSNFRTGHTFDFFKPVILKFKTFISIVRIRNIRNSKIIYNFSHSVCMCVCVGGEYPAEGKNF